MTRQHKMIQLVGLAIGTVSLALAAPLQSAFWGSSPVSAQSSSVAQASNALAPELQGKPVVVEIYASWCSGCKNIAPTLSSLKQQYKNRAHFVVLDVSDRKTTQASEAMARKLGLGRFFAATKSKTSTVAILNPATGQVIREFQNNPRSSDYQTVLNQAIVQIKAPN